MSFTDIWSAASAEDNASVPPPEPGMYDVALTGAKAFLSKKDEAWVTLSWKVISSRNKGHEWDVLFGFRSQGQANVAKNQINKLGVDVGHVGDLEALDTALKRVAGNYFSVEVKQNGDYRNTYIVGTPVNDPGMPTSAGTAPVPDVTDEDDIPF